MKSAFVPTFAALLAMAAPSAAQATTVVDIGSYGAGQFVSGFGSFGLGPGKYRVTLDLSGPPALFYSGYVEKQTVTNFFCDDISGPFYCGGDDVPTLYDFIPTTPTRYVSNITVNPFRVIPVNDGFTDRYEEFDTCCNYTFDFESGEGGSYTLSLASIPEASTWALMIIGFGAVGAAMRRRTEATFAKA